MSSDSVSSAAAPSRYDERRPFQEEDPEVLSKFFKVQRALLISLGKIVQER